MYQRWILGFSLAAGAALFGLAIHLQTNRFAFTSSAAPAENLPAPRVDDLTVSTRPEPLEPEAPVEQILVLPPVEIRGELHAPAAARSPAPAVTTEPREATEPCSPWREIGPARVNQGEPIGTRRVRELC